MRHITLIIGATGKTGTELLKLLVQHEIPARAAARNSEKARKLLPDEVEIVEFDFERPETFAPALLGVEKMFLIARPGDNNSDKVAIPLIDEARRQGIRHIVNLTSMGAEVDDSFPLRILEKYVEASGIPFTHLRPNWFMQNFNQGIMADDMRKTGALHLPAAGAKLSFVDVRDIAAIAFAAITDKRHFGKAYTITGGEALDHYQVTAMLSRVAGKTISYVPLAEDVASAALTSARVPADVIERWRKFYRLVRQGLCAPVHHDLPNILQRPALTFEQYANDHAASWK
jgi:uncharacterized protein YbjT (DUF2867 family)